MELLKSNTTNPNSNFHDFSKCDYTKHWSFSMLFKNLYICEQVLGANTIVEIGAANSRLPEMLDVNFNHVPTYTKYDIEQYDGCIQHDVANHGIPEGIGKVDAIIMSEVIEHFPVKRLPFIIDECYRVLGPGGVLVITTPTPRTDQGMEMVWPDCHDHEFTLDELLSIVKPRYFDVKSVMPWHCRGNHPEHNDIPKQLNKAVQALFMPLELATQVAVTFRRKDICVSI